jgi:hypothetical protein
VRTLHYTAAALFVTLGALFLYRALQH